MKQLLILVSLLLGTCISNAQNEPKPIRFYKDKPVRMLHYERLWDSNNTSVSKKKLKKSDALPVQKLMKYSIASLMQACYQRM